MKSTRERILQTLLNHPNSSINDLALEVNINNISVRHHLSNLMSDGFVKAEEERHGVGRPRLVYSLTDNGVEQFPTLYLALTNRLISTLKKQLPKNDFDRLFVLIAKEIASEQADKIKNMRIEDRLNFLRDNLAREGFTFNWHKTGDGIWIEEITCPFYHISINHPEVCAIDQTLISTLLSYPVEQVRCMLTGDNQCSFLIKNAAI